MCIYLCYFLLLTASLTPPVRLLFTVICDHSSVRNWNIWCQNQLFVFLHLSIFFSVQRGFLWVFYATRRLFEDFSLMFCVSLLQIFSELCRKQGWAKYCLCFAYWLIEGKEGYRHIFRLQENHELPFYFRQFNLMSNTSLFLLCVLTRDQSGVMKELNTPHWDFQETRRVAQTPTVDLAKRINMFNHFQLCRCGCLLTLGSRRKSAFCSRELMSPNGG